MDNRTYFQRNPVKLDVSRSVFPLDHKTWHSFNSGELVPLELYSDVLPGDTFDWSMSFVLRSTTPRGPIMDDAEIQVEWYFVPHDFVLHRASMTPAIDDSNHSFSAFMGAQDYLLNVTPPSSGVLLPSLMTGGVNSSSSEYIHSAACYFGMPSALFKVSGSASVPYFNPLKVLAFYKVWSDNYRDPNLMNPVTYSVTVNGAFASGSFINFTPNAYAGFVSDINVVRLNKSKLPVVCAYHGYFGSALPWPQRNATSVTLPLGESAPVLPMDSDHNLSIFPMHFSGSDIAAGTARSLDILGTAPGKGTAKSGSADSSSGNNVYPQNLYADLTQATAATINSLRSAFALQRWYEQLARGGNARLSDMAAVMFGVTPHNIGDDRCEYLGGKRIPINQTMVPQSVPFSDSDGTKPTGTLGAYSNTSDASHYFTKSFDTWGTIVGVACIRHDTIVSQSYAKSDRRMEKFDYYWPQFANLGEVPIKTDELVYVGGGNDGETFGFQEYAAEYRYIPNRVYNDFIPDFDIGGTTYHGELAYMTYADRLMGISKADQLDLGSFINASRQKGDFDETLVTTSKAAGFQWTINCFHKVKATRPMPLYSIPGLLDHH